MPTAEFNKEQILIDGGKDSVVIVKALADIPGGRTRAGAEVAAAGIVSRAGHIVVQDDTTTAVARLGVTGSAYDTLGEGKSYLGVLKVSVLKKDPRAAIVTMGQVNAAASPYPVTEEIKAGLPNIQFLF